MNAEIADLEASIRGRIERVVECTRDLSAAQLNWKPPVEGANSLCVLAAHVFGNARAWVLGIACGQDIGRDRPGEFATTCDDASQVTAAAELLLRDISDALRSLPAEALDRRGVAPRVLYGEGEPRELSTREALLHVVEHASLHLGQMQLTRDMALAHRV